jgi:Cys-rich protein (TIGR01571 family)
MAPYEYPRVPRSSNPQPQPQLSVQTQATTVRDSRFSWVDTPAEAEGRILQSHADAPPVPRLPDNISAIPVHQDAPPYISREELPQQDPLEFPQDMKHQYRPEENSPQEVQEIHYAATTTDPLQQYQQQHEQPPPEPAKDEQPTQPPPAHYSIFPDTNPLHAPATPDEHQLPRSTTTNMTILPPPTDPSRFPVSNYTPTAMPERGGSWAHSLFSCAEPSICLPSLFCPCVVYGKTQYRLSLRSDKKDPTNMLGYNTVNGSCLAFGILCGINGILSAIQHTRVRRAYDMDGEAGNVAADLLKGCCCCCCVVAQDEKELKLREEEARKAYHGKNKEGYVAPSNMVFGVPPR